MSVQVNSASFNTICVMNQCAEFLLFVNRYLAITIANVSRYGLVTCPVKIGSDKHRNLRMCIVISYAESPWFEIPCVLDM